MRFSGTCQVLLSKANISTMLSLKLFCHFLRDLAKESNIMVQGYIPGSFRRPRSAIHEVWKLSWNFVKVAFSQSFLAPAAFSRLKLPFITNWKCCFFNLCMNSFGWSIIFSCVFLPPEGLSEKANKMFTE